MPQARRGTKKFNSLNMGVSYKVQNDDRMRDARNVCTIQDRLETRHGISRHNDTAFAASPDSITYFKDNSENRYLVVKDGTTLYSAKASGAHTSIKTGLTDGNKHRGVSYNGRHIIASGSDGLFSWDGATFSPLGVAPPSAPSVAASGSGNTLTASDYQVRTTHYSSTYGFESNGGTTSSTQTVASGEQIDVTGMDTSTTNLFIDKTRIYLKDITNNSAWIFVAEVALATTSYTIDENPTSSITAPERNAAPIAGGAKYLVMFGQHLAYAGNSTFPGEVFISEAQLPDCFSDGFGTDKTVGTAGNGPISGLGVGFFQGDNLSPFMAIFKRSSIEIYSEINGTVQQGTISSEVGCISHDTIQTLDDGSIVFMSSRGWSRIVDGRLDRYRVDDKKETYDIARDDLTDAFVKSGYTYEISRTNFSNFFSIYYPTLRHYMTFISEGANTTINKCYNYELDIEGFRPYDFQVSFTGGCIGEDSSGRDVVYLVGQGGYIYSHSIAETVGTDVDKDGNDVAIPAFAQLYWMAHSDLDATSNFGVFIIRGTAQANPITVKCWVDYDLTTPTDKSYDMSADETGFILDVDQLDVGILGEGLSRKIVRGRGSILVTGQSLLLGFYKTQAGESMGIIEAQLDYSKNGNTAS